MVDLVDKGVAELLQEPDGYVRELLEFGRDGAVRPERPLQGAGDAEQAERQVGEVVVRGSHHGAQPGTARAGGHGGSLR